MILAVDIGNTNITVGGFKNDGLLFVARISTDILKTKDEYAQKLSHILALYNVEKSLVDGAIISSVVPVLNGVMLDAIKFIYGVDAIMIGPGIKTGMNIHCDDPSSVGADLICACVAVKNLYQIPALIIDMGTATKMMLVDKCGAFAGVSIIPGVNMGLKALHTSTAQLPQISLSTPPSVIGKNTVDCMRSGIIFGNAALIDGMIDRFCEETGENLKIFATGGLAGSIIRHCKHEIVIDENLVLKGLNILYKKNN